MPDPTAAILPSLSSALADIVARTKSAIVSVHSHRSRASGFIWKPGLIVTADEALADEGEVSVKLADGTVGPASIAGRDHTTDIALLRLDTGNAAPVAPASVIPSATIGRVAGRLETHGRIARGYLGVGLQPVKLDDGIGAMVMSVDQSGPSAAAGIRQGDIIVGWNDEKLSGVRSLLRALGPDSVGSVVDVEIRRGGEPVRIKLTIGERADA